MTTRLHQLLILIPLIVGLTGCLESSFQLSEQSRLPKWFSVPQKSNRGDYAVQMDLHSTMSGGKVVLKLFEKGNLLNIEKHVVTTNDQPGIRSVNIDKHSEGSKKGYPRYKVVTINGITDVIELRRMEPVFYMTDDPVVWEELGVKQQ